MGLEDARGRITSGERRAQKNYSGKPSIHIPEKHRLAAPHLAPLLAPSAASGHARPVGSLECGKGRCCCQVGVQRGVGVLFILMSFSVIVFFFTLVNPLFLFFCSMLIGVFSVIFVTNIAPAGAVAIVMMVRGG